MSASPLPRRSRRRRTFPRISDWRIDLVPSDTLAVPCPPGLHRGTYQRLVNEYNRVLARLEELPRRRLPPGLRNAYDAQFLNRIVRIRRRLGLWTPQPRGRRWYRASEAALFLGVSTKSLVRWANSGFIKCRRDSYRTHRYYAMSELLRVRRLLRT
jgi:Helix-turn-helix domain